MRCWISSAGIKILSNVIILACHHNICCGYAESSKHVSTKKINKYKIFTFMKLLTENVFHTVNIETQSSV